MLVPFPRAVRRVRRLVLLAVALVFSFSWVVAGPGPRPAAPRLQVRRVALNVFVHTSYHRYAGKAEPVASNGLIVSTSKGALLIDTAWDPDQTLELLRWVADSLHQRVRLVVVSQAQEARLGGLAVLKANNIKVYSTPLTARRAAQLPFGTPTAALRPYTLIRAGRTRLELFFAGPGYSPDNIVAWLPKQRVLFGGDLVLDAKAETLNRSADTNLKLWPATLRKLQSRYPRAEVLVPGRGQWGSPDLLAHTLHLLRTAPRKPQTALNDR